MPNKLKLPVVLLLALPLFGAEKWGVYEIHLEGPAAGNPYTEVRLGAHFRYRNRTVDADGFYDGGGVYRIRFMPDETGDWTWESFSETAALNAKHGAFTVTAPAAGNHGPVRVAHTSHFAYEDGRPYVPIGTTSYAWTHQGDALEEETLGTLRAAPFNKIRMCVFPKHYTYNSNEPVYYPFPRSADGVNDYTQFNPKFFRHLEKRIEDLQGMGIEADLILFHPYDNWGYSKMPAEADDRYLRYIVARLAAYRNVWWSMANEYDLVKTKTMADWDRFFRIVQDTDPYHHLRSIHHSVVMYDHSKPWVTHVSLQSNDLDKAAEYVKLYRKPVIYDEMKYEGDIPQRWGNISAEEMTRRFWLATVQGAYAGHSETYLDSQDVLWWSKGGKLKGQSAARIRFLRNILERAPEEGLDSLSTYYYAAGVPGKYALWYFDINQPGSYRFELAPGVSYRAEIIDPWNMTITPVEGRYEGKFELKLPAKPGMAVRFIAGPAKP